MVSRSGSYLRGVLGGHPSSTQTLGYAILLLPQPMRILWDLLQQSITSYFQILT